MAGYIKLYRDIQQNWLWETERARTKLEAWIDLLMLVNFAEGTHVVGNEVKVVPLGSKYITIRQLSKRWKWSTTKVTSFLNLLKSDEMILLENSNNKKTLLTVVNWELYQFDKDIKKTQKRQEKDKKKTLNNNENKENKENNIPSLFPEEELPPDKPVNQVPYQKILALYHETCISFPKIRALSKEREEHIGARYKQYKCDIEVFRELFLKVESSDFLKGDNDRKWKATLDWMMNETNMAKILEGKYENKPKPEPPKPKEPAFDPYEIKRSWE